MPAMQVALAGAIELVSAAVSHWNVHAPGPCSDRCTADVDAVGRTFSNGYVWALPEGGYELRGWAVLIAVFAVLGAADIRWDWNCGEATGPAAPA